LELGPIFLHILYTSRIGANFKKDFKETVHKILIYSMCIDIAIKCVVQPFLRGFFLYFFDSSYIFNFVTFERIIFKIGFLR
jgi:hypothetical protein